MTIVKVPLAVDTSPQDGMPLTFDTETRLFRDGRGNEYSAEDLARCRPGNGIRGWIERNYPQSTGDPDQ